jgi:hypothetical protein
VMNLLLSMLNLACRIVHYAFLATRPFLWAHTAPILGEI